MESSAKSQIEDLLKKYFHLILFSYFVCNFTMFCCKILFTFYCISITVVTFERYCHSDNVFCSFHPFVWSFVHEEDCAKRFQATFMKPYRIVGYCCGKNSLNCEVDSTQSG